MKEDVSGPFRDALQLTEATVRAEVYPIPNVPTGRLAIMPRPRAGDWLEDEVASWRQQGLDVIVSLLEDSEIDELGLGEEPTLCAAGGLRLLRLPIPDRGVPSSHQPVTDLITVLVSELQSGRGVGIHCRIGVGRSALLAVCVLTALGAPSGTAWESVQKSRGMTVPDTPAQRAWVTDWWERSWRR